MESAYPLEISLVNSEVTLEIIFSLQITLVVLCEGTLPPRRHLAMSSDNLDCHPGWGGRVCCIKAVGRGWGCGPASTEHKDSPHDRDTWIQMSTVPELRNAESCCL